jgi:hypothetical protein
MVGHGSRVLALARVDSESWGGVAARVGIPSRIAGGDLHNWRVAPWAPS